MDGSPRIVPPSENEEYNKNRSVSGASCIYNLSGQ